VWLDDRADLVGHVICQGEDPVRRPDQSGYGDRGQRSRGVRLPTHRCPDKNVDMKGRVSGAQISFEVHPVCFGLLVERFGTGGFEAEMVTEVTVDRLEECVNRPVGTGALVVVEIDVLAVSGHALEPG